VLAAPKRYLPLIPAQSLGLAEANARLNSATNIRFQCGEGFETLESWPLPANVLTP